MSRARGADGPHGWIILDKPVGLGSTHAVGAVKRVLREAGFGKVKVGHGGTLDPLASGVLPVALGEATKLCGRMLDSDKVYAFTVAFGTQTDGLDAEGAVVATRDVRPTHDAIAAVLPRFTGAIDQVPPAYSAIKIDGQRAYDRARAGEAVAMPSRAVTVHALTLNNVTPASGPVETATLTAAVSKGTYIRSLARDIALALGTVGHVTWLHRIKAGPFGLDRAISLDKLADLGQGAALEDIMLPLEAGLDGIPALDLSPEATAALRQGRVLTGVATHDGLYWARRDSIPLALVEVSVGTVRVVRGFNI